MSKEKITASAYSSRVFRPMHKREDGVEYFYTGLSGWMVNGPFILSCASLTALAAFYTRVDDSTRLLLIGATLACIALFVVMFFLGQKANPVYLEGNVLRMKDAAVTLDETTAVRMEKDFLVFENGADTLRFSARSRGTWELIRRCRDIYRVQFARGVMYWFEMEKRGQNGML